MSTINTNSINEVFDLIYQHDVWEGGSGPGSMPSNTIEYRAFIERFVETNNVKSITDFGCGDWQFSKHIDFSLVQYTGFDVVENVIRENRRRFSNTNLNFNLLRDINELPGGDLLIAKEVLQHLPNNDIIEYISHFRKKYKFCLFTNAAEPIQSANQDITRGGFRPLQLDLAPFNVPGAKIFTYYPQAKSHIFKNTVYLALKDKT